MSMNYTTWYLIGLSNGTRFKICKTAKERDKYIAELSNVLVDMQVVNSARPHIEIRIDRHAKPNGPLM